MEGQTKGAGAATSVITDMGRAEPAPVATVRPATPRVRRRNAADGPGEEGRGGGDATAWGSGSRAQAPGARAPATAVACVTRPPSSVGAPDGSGVTAGPTTATTVGHPAPLEGVGAARRVPHGAQPQPQTPVAVRTDGRLIVGPRRKVPATQTPRGVIAALPRRHKPREPQEDPVAAKGPKPRQPSLQPGRAPKERPVGRRTPARRRRPPPERHGRVVRREIVGRDGRVA